MITILFIQVRKLKQPLLGLSSLRLWPGAPHFPFGVPFLPPSRLWPLGSCLLVFPCPTEPSPSVGPAGILHPTLLLACRVLGKPQAGEEERGFTKGGCLWRTRSRAGQQRYLGTGRVALSSQERLLRWLTTPCLAPGRLGPDSRSSAHPPKPRRPLVFWKTAFPGQLHSGTSDDRNPDLCLHLGFKGPGMEFSAFARGWLKS